MDRLASYVDTGGGGLIGRCVEQVTRLENKRIQKGVRKREK